MRNLVIKGAQYLIEDSILIPHFTGEFQTVDCTEYTTKKELLQRYDRNYFKSVKDDYIELDGVKYYYAEYSPFSTSEDWSLISDLSDLEFTE